MEDPLRKSKFTDEQIAYCLRKPKLRVPTFARVPTV